MSGWATATIGAGAAIIGALVVTLGTFLNDRRKDARREQEEHSRRLAEFAAVMQIRGSFVASYPGKPQSKNPLTIAAYNLDLRLNQRLILERLFHVEELLYRTANEAMRTATDEEMKAITDALTLTSQIQIGEPLPDEWGQAVSHVTYLARSTR
jgi:hypothetical protein